MPLNDAMWFLFSFNHNRGSFYNRKQHTMAFQKHYNNAFYNPGMDERDFLFCGRKNMADDGFRTARQINLKHPVQLVSRSVHLSSTSTSATVISERADSSHGHGLFNSKRDI